MIAVAEGLKATFHRLEMARVEYMTVGSIASTVYGEPRLTRDLDLVIRAHRDIARLFMEMFPAEEYYLPPREVIVQEFTRQGQFNLLHNPSGLKVDVVVQKSTSHGLAEFERRRRLELLPGVLAWIAAPEDVIIAKLRFYRDGESEKHLKDIRGILAQTPVDMMYLESWIQSLELSSSWAKV